MQPKFCDCSALGEKITLLRASRIIGVYSTVANTVLGLSVRKLKLEMLTFFRQCSECVSSSSDESEVSIKIDPDAPRRLRETIKEPKKFTPYIKEKHVKVSQWETFF